MKKNNIKIIALALTSSLLYSCKMDEMPQDRIGDNDFWKSTSEARLYVNNFYNNYLQHDNQAYFTLGIYSKDADQGSDNMVRFQYNQNDLNGERTLPASDGTNWNWTDIRNVNYFLTNYHRIQENFENYKKYVGEAYFFKSLLYFEKLKKYGDLPWYDKVLNINDTEELNKERESRHNIAHRILADLDKAIEYLPNKGTAEAFRINKQVAQLLKARIALYEGTWEKYHAGTPFGVAGKDGSDFLQIAATTADAVIASGRYDLDNVGVANGYWRLFNQTDYSQSKEIMLWRRYSPSDGVFTRWAAYMRYGTGRGITKSLVDSYLCTDGEPISSSSLYQGDASLVSVVTNRDPRLNQTIRVNDGEHYITTPNVPFKYPAFYAGANEDKNVTGYELHKGHNTDYAQQQTGTGSQGFIYFRYAEALLISAEAKAELGTITQNDVDNTINKLRARVGMPNLEIGAITPDPKWQFPSLSPIINEIRRERRVELALEGYRHDDIWRWAAADELIVGWKPKGAKKAQFASLVDGSFTTAMYDALQTDADGYIEPFKNVDALSSGYKFNINRDYLLPIPQDQVTLNKKLTQNPGW